MKNVIFYFTVTLGILISLSPCQAEVSLENNVLSVDIHETTIKEVIDEIGQQGHFNVIAFEESRIANVRISKKFWNLSLLAGLDRILSGWNYSISRDSNTGRITKLYLVSLRTQRSSNPQNSLKLNWQGQRTQEKNERPASRLELEQFDQDAWELTDQE